MQMHIFENTEPKFPHKFTNSKDVADVMRGFTAMDREAFFIIFLDAQNNMIDYICHAVGSTGSSAVYPRDVLKSCLYKNARAVILCHNHPGNDTAPSIQDKEITKVLVYALQLIDVEVLDHVIIGKDNHFSFADAGLIADMNEDYKRDKHLFTI